MNSDNLYYGDSQHKRDKELPLDQVKKDHLVAICIIVATDT